MDQRHQFSVTLLLLGAMVSTVCAELPDSSAHELAEDFLETPLLDFSSCTVRARWCLEAMKETDSELQVPPSKIFGPGGVRDALEKHSADYDPAGASRLEQTEFDYRDDSLKAMAKSLEDLQRVTVWSTDKTRVYVGLDDEGRAGIHFAPKEQKANGKKSTENSP